VKEITSPIRCELGIEQRTNAGFATQLICLLSWVAPMLRQNDQPSASKAKKPSPGVNPAAAYAKDGK